jgi:cbb3-type cytochrome oxidase cytochrome c subunit
MKNITMFVVAVIIVLGFTVLCGSLAIAADTGAMPAGQKLFMDKKCNTCHSLESLKIPKKLASSKGPDLSNVGAQRTSDWIVKWLKKEVDLNGKKHLSAFSGTPEEAKTLSDWLATLKTAPK